MTTHGDIIIRPLETADIPGCLAIFESNIPEYVASSEQPEFERFLEARESPFFVAVEAPNSVVACGGYYFDRKRLAGLTWGMVHRRRHRGGIGTLILKHRLAMIEASGAVPIVRVNTSQFSRGFFERHGFSVVSVVADGYASGIDRIEMVRRVQSYVAA